MKIFFWFYKPRKNRKDYAPIMLRITIDENRSDLNTGLDIREEQWDANDQRIKGNTDDIIQMNTTLNTLHS